MRSRDELRRDFRIGFGISLTLMAVSAVLAVLKYLLAGVDGFHRTTGMGLPQVLGLYALGALTGGFMIGVLRPLRHSAWGSFIIGWFAAFPLFLAITVIMMPHDEWYPPGVVIAVIVTTILGGGSAAAMQSETKDWTQ